MAMLSGGITGSAAAALVSTPPTTVASTYIALNGEAKGFYASSTATSTAGTIYGLAASGKLTPVGQSLVAGTIHTGGSTSNGMGTGDLIVSAPGGTLSLHLTQFFPPSAGSTSSGTPVAPSGLWFHFVITKGTGKYAGDTGIGNVNVHFTPGTLPPGSPAATVVNGFGSVTLDFSSVPPPTARNT
jgi:hypothetical protein